MVPQYVLLLLLIVLCVRQAEAEHHLRTTRRAIPTTEAPWNFNWQGSSYSAHGLEIDRTVSYFEAKESCNGTSRLASHLAVFPDDFNILYPFMRHVSTMHFDFTLFVSLEQQKTSEASEPDKEWYWVYPDGSRDILASDLWLPGQPDDPNGTLNYGAFMRRGDEFGLGNVASSLTSGYNGYVCQYDPMETTGQIPPSGTPPPIMGTTSTISSIFNEKGSKITTTSTNKRLENTKTTTPAGVKGSAANKITSTLPAVNTTTKAASSGATCYPINQSQKEGLIAQLESCSTKINQLREAIKAMKMKTQEFHFWQTFPDMQRKMYEFDNLQTLLEPLDLTISNVTNVLRHV